MFSTLWSPPIVYTQFLEQNYYEFKRKSPKSSAAHGRYSGYRGRYSDHFPVQHMQVVKNYTEKQLDHSSHWLAHRFRSLHSEKKNMNCPNVERNSLSPAASVGASGAAPSAPHARCSAIASRASPSPWRQLLYLCLTKAAFFPRPLRSFASTSLPPTPIPTTLSQLPAPLPRSVFKHRHRSASSPSQRSTAAFAASPQSPARPSSLIALINCEGGQLPGSSSPGGAGASAQRARARPQPAEPARCFWQERSEDGWRCGTALRDPPSPQDPRTANAAPGEPRGERRPTCTAPSADPVTPRAAGVFHFKSLRAACKQVLAGGVRSSGVGDSLPRGAGKTGRKTGSGV